MSDNKKFTPKEAALAVLAKAQELYKGSALAKAESKHDRCVKDVERNSPEVDDPHAVCVAEGVKPEKWSKSEEVLSKAMEIGPKPVRKPGEPIARPKGKMEMRPVPPKSNKPMEVGKSEENPDEQADAELGHEVEEAVHQHEATSEHPGQHADEAGMKGHIKLAKFMGRMQHKKEQRSKPIDKADGQTLGAAIGFPGTPATAPMPSPPPSSPAPMMKNK